MGHRISSELCVRALHSNSQKPLAMISLQTRNLSSQSLLGRDSGATPGLRCWDTIVLQDCLFSPSEFEPPRV